MQIAKENEKLAILTLKEKIATRSAVEKMVLFGSAVRVKKPFCEQADFAAASVNYDI